jgi:uncharacterized alpha-E superfamily protein
MDVRHPDSRRRKAFLAKHDEADAQSVIDFLLRDKTNPSSSVISVIEAARNNARLVRTALTREVWEATNESWLALKDALARQVRERDLPEVAGPDPPAERAGARRAARHDAAQRCLRFRPHRHLPRTRRQHRPHSRREILRPAALGDVRRLVARQCAVGDHPALGLRPARLSLAQQAGDINPRGIAEFLIQDRRLPRSLAFCYTKIVDNLGYLADDYGERLPCHDTAEGLLKRLRSNSVEAIFDKGLHEFLEDFIRDNNRLGIQIEQDYRFYG